MSMVRLPPLPRMSVDDVVITSIVVVLGGLAFLSPAQPDTWTHLRTGKEIWDGGSVIYIERFSHVSAGTPWHNHEWLTQLLFYGLFAIGGPVLLTLAAGGCALLAVVMSWRMTRADYEWRLGMLLMLLLIVTPVFAVRPQVLSMALLMLAVSLVRSGRAMWMPPLVVVWANAHGGVLLGVMLVVVDALTALVWSPGRRRRAVLVAIACVAAPMLTPLGWHYWPRVYQTVSESRALGIMEFRSALEWGALPFWALFGSVVAMTLWRWRDVPERGAARTLVLFAGILAVASVLSVRNAPFFALVAGPAVGALTGEPAVRRRRHEDSVIPLVAVTCAAAVTAAVVLYNWRQGGAHLGWQPMSAAAVAAIRDCPEPMFNTFAAGGTLLWFVQDRPVFVDGRVEVYPVALLEQSRRADLYGEYRELFQQFQVRCAVVPTGSPMAKALGRDSSMRATFADSQWTVFAGSELE